MAQFIMKMSAGGQAPKAKTQEEKQNEVNVTAEELRKQAELKRKREADKKPTFKWDGVGEYYLDDIYKRAVEGIEDHIQSHNFTNKRAAGFRQKVTDVLQGMRDGEVSRAASGEFVDSTGRRASTGKFKTNIFGTPKVDDNTSYNDAAYYIGEVLRGAPSLEQIKAREEAEAKNKSGNTGIGKADPNRGKTQTEEKGDEGSEAKANEEIERKAREQQWLQELQNNPDSFGQLFVEGHQFRNTAPKFNYMGTEYDIQDIPNEQVRNLAMQHMAQYDKSIRTNDANDIRWGYEGDGKYLVSDLTSYASGLEGTNYGLFKVNHNGSSPTQDDYFVLRAGTYDSNGNFIADNTQQSRYGNVVEGEDGNWFFQDESGFNQDLGQYRQGVWRQVNPNNYMDFDNNISSIFDLMYTNPSLFDKGTSRDSVYNKLNLKFKEIMNNYRNVPNYSHPHFSRAATQARTGKYGDHLIWTIIDPSSKQRRDLRVFFDPQGNFSVRRFGQVDSMKQGGNLAKNSKNQLIVSASIGAKIGEAMDFGIDKNVDLSDTEIKYGDDLVRNSEQGRYAANIFQSDEPFEDLGGVINDHDKIRLASSLTDILGVVTSFVPGAHFAGAAAGVGATGMSAYADFKDENVGFWDGVKNLGVNLALDAVSLIPAGKATKAIKSAKVMIPILASAMSTANAFWTQEDRDRMAKTFDKLTSVDKLMTFNTDDVNNLTVVARALLTGKNIANRTKAFSKRTKYTGDQYEYKANIVDADGKSRTTKHWVDANKVDQGSVKMKDLVAQVASEKGVNPSNVKIAGIKDNSSIKGAISKSDINGKYIHKSQAEYQRRWKALPKYNPYAQEMKVGQNTWLGGTKGVRLLSGISDANLMKYYHNPDKKSKDGVYMGTEEVAAKAKAEKKAAKLKNKKENPSIFQRAKNAMSKNKSEVKGSNAGKFVDSDDYKVILGSDNKVKVVKSDVALGKGETYINSKNYKSLIKDGRIDSADVANKINNFNKSKSSNVKSEVESKTKESSVENKPKVKETPKTKEEVKTKKLPEKETSTTKSDIETSSTKAKKEIKVTSKQNKESLNKAKKTANKLNKNESKAEVKKDSNPKDVKINKTDNKSKIEKAKKTASDIKESQKKNISSKYRQLELFTDKKQEIKPKTNKPKQLEIQFEKVKKVANKSKTKAKPKNKTITKKQLGGIIKKLKIGGGFNLNKSLYGKSGIYSSPLLTTRKGSYDPKNFRVNKGMNYKVDMNKVDMGGVRKSFIDGLDKLIKKDGAEAIFEGINTHADNFAYLDKSTGNTVSNPVYSTNEPLTSGLQRDFRFFNQSGDDHLRKHSVGTGTTEQGLKFDGHLGDRTNIGRRLLSNQEQVEDMRNYLKTSGLDKEWQVSRAMGDRASQDQQYRIERKLGDPVMAVSENSINNPEVMNRLLTNKIDPELTQRISNVGGKPGKTKSTFLGGLNNRMKGLNVLGEDLLELERMQRGLQANRRIAKKQKEGIKPLLIDTPEHFSPVHGDLSARNFAEAKASRMSSLAANPRTSDGALHLAGQLEAQRQGDALRYDSAMRDNAMFRETGLRDWTNRNQAHAARVEASNKNRSSMLQADAAKKQIDAAKIAADYSQVINPFLSNIENSMRQNRANNKQLRTQINMNTINDKYSDDLFRQRTIYTNPNASVEERTAAKAEYNNLLKKRNQEILNTQKSDSKFKYMFTTSLAKGGRISAEDRAAIQNAKDFNKQMRDNQKTFHKTLTTIMKDNSSMIRSVSPLTASLIKGAMEY